VALLGVGEAAEHVQADRPRLALEAGGEVGPGAAGPPDLELADGQQELGAEQAGLGPEGLLELGDGAGPVALAVELPAVEDPAEGVGRRDRSGELALAGGAGGVAEPGPAVGAEEVAGAGGGMVGEGPVEDPEGSLGLDPGVLAGGRLGDGVGPDQEEFVPAPVDLGLLRSGERGREPGGGPFAIGPGLGELVERRAGGLAGRREVAELADPGELGVAEQGLVAGPGEPGQAAPGLLASPLVVEPAPEPTQEVRPPGVEPGQPPVLLDPAQQRGERLGPGLPSPVAERPLGAIQDPLALAAEVVGLPEGRLVSLAGPDPGEDQSGQDRQREAGQGGGGGLAAGPLAEPLAGPDPAGQHGRASEEAAEVLGQRSGLGVALPGLLVQALQADRLQVARQAGPEPGGRDRVVVDDLVERLQGRGPLERRSPGEHLVEDRAERVQVGRRPDDAAPAQGLLGGHEAGRAHHLA